MRKLFIFSIIAILSLICIYINREKSTLIKVFKIQSPYEIYLDLNRNFIFDEDKTYKIKNLHDISNFDENVKEEQKFLFKYFADKKAKTLINNQFVKIIDGDILIKGKSYKTLLLNSDFFYDDTNASKEKFKETLNKYNIDDFFILNKKSKFYHKLTCPNARNSKSYEIINIREIKSNYKPAQCCIKQEEKSPKIKQNYVTKYSDGSIRIYFLDLNKVNKPDNTCKSDACIALRNAINSAKSNIDFAIYGYNNQPIIYKALSEAKNRGVTIRWVTNYDNQENAYYPELENLKKLLPNYKTNHFEINTNKYGLMHNKFFIIDNKTVYTGSANISSTDLSEFNANYTILIDSVDLAKIYKKEFEQMYNNKFGNNKSIIEPTTVKIQNTYITPLFSPKNQITDNYIINLINNANEYIYISVFLITDKNIEKALINAKLRGVDIKIINDATNSKNKYSIHKALRLNRIQVKTENYAGKMHMKTMIIDDKYSLLGSMNFTTSGNKRNDENVLILEDSSITKYIKETFNHIWNKIPDKYLKYDPMAESIESIGSCYDGIDNDFDGKIDMIDKGCIIKR